MTLYAACPNCTNFCETRCGLGHRPDEGSLICGQYEITQNFRDEIVRVVMKDLMTEIRETAIRAKRMQRAKTLWN